MKECRGLDGIIPILYSFISDDFVLIGMEYCPGGSLENYVIDRVGDFLDEEVK